VTGLAPAADERRRAVLVLERALEDVGEDLHVAVAVRAEARSRLDPVVVDHAQAAKAHVARVVVLAERERVPAVEPAPVGPAAVLRASNRDHGMPPAYSCIIVTTADRTHAVPATIRIAAKQ
jgi:hypothetical protein